MELYNKEFVYFDWDDKLEGKKGFFADSIIELKQDVKDNNAQWYGEIFKNSTYDDDNTNYPFETIDEACWHHGFRFCYYDPYYEFRKAYLEGKQIQFKDSIGNWRDIEGEPIFTRNEYRIKPNIYEVHTTDRDYLGIYSKDYQNSKEHQHCFFDGTFDECKEWVKEHEKFYKVMCYWEQGRTIETMGPDTDWCQVETPHWYTDHEYRVKDEWQEQVQKATDEGYARTMQTMQLTTAKEIIKDLLSLCEGETDSKLVFTRAEQFLNEVEK